MKPVEAVVDMKYHTVIIGDDVNKRVPIFRANLSPDYEYTCKSGHATVFVIEEFSLRQVSDVAVTVILDYVEDTTCIVTICSAGGKAGWLRLDLLGAERSRLNKILKFFQTLVEEKGWR